VPCALLAWCTLAPESSHTVGLEDIRDRYRRKRTRCRYGCTAQLIRILDCGPHLLPLTAQRRLIGARRGILPRREEPASDYPARRGY